MEKFKKIFPVFLVVLLVGVSCKKENHDDDDDDEDSVRISANFDLIVDEAWGTTSGDDFSGAVLDNTGSVYFTGTKEPDGFQADIMVAKTDGASILWAKRLDAGDQDYQPSPSENGHSQGGGGSRCIATDDFGGFYVTGTSSQGFNEAFVVKYNTAGVIQWQTFWEADNSGLAKGSAKAYALDVAGGKVFVTGTTGAGVGGESSHVFLLVLDAATGDVQSQTKLGIDPSPGYNDIGYSVRSQDGNNVFIAGWEGENNSGILIKLTDGGSTFQWYNKIDVGYAGRFTDIDFDASGNVYLAADIRGSYTSLGVVKCDPSSGNVLWSKQYYGLDNDRNNISCLRVINGYLYVGGRGSLENYDTGLYGDGLLLKLSLSGELERVYNYFTDHSDDSCGERVEAILHDGTNFILMGETWPEFSKIQGLWYLPEGTWTTLNTESSISVSVGLQGGMGITVFRTFQEYSMIEQLYDPSEGSRGSADFRLWKIPSL